MGTQEKKLGSENTDTDVSSEATDKITRGDGFWSPRDFKLYPNPEEGLERVHAI